MMVRRIGASACCVKGQVYVLGGCTDQNVKTRLCERYDIEKKKWELIAKMQLGKARIGCCVFDDTIYAFFGSDSYGNLSNTIERYSIKENVWINVNPINYLPGFDRTFCQTITINTDQILIFGGMRDSIYFKDQTYFNRNIMIFTPSTQAFSIIQNSLPIDFIPLSNAVVHNNAVYCIGTIDIYRKEPS